MLVHLTKREIKTNIEGANKGADEDQKKYKEPMLAKTNRAFAKNMGMGFKYLSAKVAIVVWNALARPILEYGSEI